MNTPELFKFAPEIERSWISLITEPTPVHAFEGVREWLNHPRLFVKREDLTAPIYGGNKVRNLEFLLGEALALKKKRVITLGPLGSNFIAALAAQARRVGIPAQAYQFVPAYSPQIIAHARFSGELGLKARVSRGGKYLGVLSAATRVLNDRLRRGDSYWISPGGSSAHGVLGHVNAALELARQVREGETPEPDYLVVGVGTCGTLAGLLAGLRLSELNTQVIGVRCVDAMVCNPYRIVQLANQALRRIGVSPLIRLSDVVLRDPKSLVYGEPLRDSQFLIEAVRVRSGIALDTTYTTKVFSYLKENIEHGEFRNRSILYWNTYSPMAIRNEIIEPVVASTLGFPLRSSIDL